MRFFEINSKPESVKTEEKSSFDIDKRAEITDKPEKTTSSNFDIDKRADVSDKKETASDSGFDIDKRAEVKSENASENNRESKEGETEKIEGGSYKDVHSAHSGDGVTEVHHMPADVASELSFDDGPCIAMERKHHRETASCGSSREAKEYQQKQAEYIANGQFREALQMDIDDIHEKFGDKYDKAIEQMLKYVDKLEAEGKI